jgi:hypothetical protein
MMQTIPPAVQGFRTVQIASRTAESPESITHPSRLTISAFPAGEKVIEQVE